MRTAVDPVNGVGNVAPNKVVKLLIVGLLRWVITELSLKQFNGIVMSITTSINGNNMYHSHYELIHYELIHYELIHYELIHYELIQLR